MPRRSSHIDRRQTQNFLQGVPFAAIIGRPLNWYVTLNLAQAGCPAAEVSAAFEKLRDDRYTRWLRYQSSKTLGQKYGPPVYAWSVENVDHTHVNWLVHVPRPLIKEFRRKLPEWVMSVSGASSLLKNMIHIEPIVGAVGLSRYILKGTDPRAAKKQKIIPQPQGIVTGKRCGVSVSIGKSARERYWASFRVSAA